ncbi:MAG: arabinofuranosyltransferase [Neolewinella sp.]|jgi:arabinofuranosyltransferase
MNELPLGPTTSTSGTAAWRWIAIAVLPAVLLAAWQAAWPYPFFSDDSFISLRYTERLLQGDGLTWTDVDGVPQRVEGYSNLLWVVLTAAVGALGVELVFAARLLGGLATFAGLWFLAAALRPRDVRSAIVAAVAPLLVASTQPVMIWTLAGLEGPLVMALLAWGFGGLVRHYSNRDVDRSWLPRTLLIAGVPFALACWTRPDGPLWAFTAGTGLAAMSISSGVTTACRRAFWFGLPALLAVVSQVAFRLSYYGDYLPNTAHVKAEFDPESFPAGYAFVESALTAMPGLSVSLAMGLGLCLNHRRTRTFTTVLLLPVIAWLCYLTAIGGDHFPGLRLLHGVIVPMALLAAVGIRAVRHQHLRIGFATIGTLLACYWNVDVARNDPRSREARNERWEWHGKVLGETIGRAFGERQARIAIDAAGALPFYSKLPALDMLGLCDHTIATTPFPSWIDTVRKGIPKPPGHMRGNGTYVIEQRPDVITYQHAPGLPLPVFVSACEFESDPRFFEHYRCMLVDLDNPEILPGVREAHIAPLWIRTEGRAGIERSADRVVVPAYLFGSFQAKGPAVNRHQPPTGDPAMDGKYLKNLAAIVEFWNQRSPTVVPTDDGELALSLAKNQTAGFELPLPVGTWRVTVEPKTSRGNVRVAAGGQFSTDVLTVAGTMTAEDTMPVTSGLVMLELVAPEDSGSQPVRIVLDRTR